MTFKDAMTELDKLADGKYHSLKFELNVHSDGTRKSSITCYISDYGYSGVFASYELALTDMREIMNQKANPALVDEMMPEGDSI